MTLETKSQKHDTGVWMEIKFIVEPEEYKFLKLQARRESILVSEVVRQIILRHIGKERGSL